MGTGELLVVRRAGAERRYLFNRVGDPWFQNALYFGPSGFLALANDAQLTSMEAADPSGLLLDLDRREAIALVEEIPDAELARARASVCAGIWRVLGWTLTVNGRPERRVRASQVEPLWAHEDGLRGARVQEQHIAQLRSQMSDAGFGVHRDANFPLLVEGGRPSNPRELCFAVGSAAAAGRLAEDGSLKSPCGWLGRTEPCWAHLNNPALLASELAAQSGSCETELRENLIEALDLALSSRGQRSWDELDDQSRSDVAQEVEALLRQVELL